jgi:hypothetical protein
MMDIQDGQHVGIDAETPEQKRFLYQIVQKLKQYPLGDNVLLKLGSSMDDEKREEAEHVCLYLKLID